MLVQICFICATLFELPYFIRRTVYVLERWAVERKKRADDRSARIVRIDRRTAALNGADVQALDSAAASTASDSAEASSEADSVQSGSRADAADVRADATADFECCEFPRAVSEWWSSFSDGSDGPSGGIFGFYGWIGMCFRLIISNIFC